MIGTIYEARPNVTIDVASLCLKTGNAVILRGGKETQHSNQILVEVVQNALEQAGLPRHAVQAITDPNRELVMQLLKLDRYVDMIIPRLVITAILLPVLSAFTQYLKMCFVPETIKS